MSYENLMKGSAASIPRDPPLQPKWYVLNTIGQHSGPTPSTSLGGPDDAKSFANIPCTPSNNLHSLSSPWPFSMWGMDILGPLPKAPWIVKFLLVVIDYFTKWIEVRPLQEILANEEVEKFTWKYIICRYALPYIIVIDSGTCQTLISSRDYH